MELGDAEALVQAVAGGLAREPDPEALDALYRSLPQMNCKGKCASSCGPAPASPLEMDRIRRRGVAWVDWTSVRLPLGQEMAMACSALDTKSGRCRAYEDRPMVCRIWGLVEELACPWGCVPEGGFLDSVHGLRLMNLSLWYGGSRQGMEPDRWERLAAHPGRRARMLEFFGRARPVVEEPAFLQATIRVRPAG